jgi:cytochrome c1
MNRARSAGAAAVAALLLGCEPVVPADQTVAGADAARGRLAIERVACGVCHSIPGIAAAQGVVGPPLARFGLRSMIAGVVPNRPAVLVRWIREAPAIAPETAMPRLPLSEEEARDIAAYLYRLR